MTEAQTVYNQSNVFLENREKLRVTGVADVESFNEQEINVITQLGEFILGGKGLKIAKLDVESGELLVEGEIDSFFYHEQNRTKKSKFGRFLA